MYECMYVCAYVLLKYDTSDARMYVCMYACKNKLTATTGAEVSISASSTIAAENKN